MYLIKKPFVLIWMGFGNTSDVSDAIECIISDSQKKNGQFSVSRINLSNLGSPKL